MLYVIFFTFYDSYVLTHMRAHTLTHTHEHTHTNKQTDFKMYGKRLSILWGGMSLVFLRGRGLATYQ